MLQDKTTAAWSNDVTRDDSVWILNEPYLPKAMMIGPSDGEDLVIVPAPARDGQI